MSDETKDLSVDVKTVLRGEVLSPGDEGYEPGKKGKAAQEVRDEERLAQQEGSYVDNLRFWSQMANMENYQQNQYTHQNIGCLCPYCR